MGPAEGRHHSPFVVFLSFYFGYVVFAALHRGWQLILEGCYAVEQLSVRGEHQLVICRQDGRPSAKRPCGFFFRDSGFLLEQDEDFWFDVVDLEDGCVLEVTIDTTGDYTYHIQRFPLETAHRETVETFLATMRWTAPYHLYMRGAANHAAPKRRQ